MSGRIKGIVLNLLVPGTGFIAQGRWGWGLFYLILAIISGVLTIIGYFVFGIISAFHAGLLGDVKHELSKKDIEKIAIASAKAQRKITEDTPSKK